MLSALRHSLCRGLLRTASLAHSVSAAATNALEKRPEHWIHSALFTSTTQRFKSAAPRTLSYPYPIAYGEAKTVPVYDLNKQIVDHYTLDANVFGQAVRVDILHRVVRWQRAKRQQGTHKVKDRSEVRGGGRKPRPQKGGGVSRQGSIRAPQWRGGGISHGPVPRSHAHDLPKKVRRLGLKCALSAKSHEQRLIIVDSLCPSEPKTKLMQQHLDALLQDAPRQSVLLVDEATTSPDGGECLRQASRNLPGVEIVPAIGANVYSILKRDYLVLTRAAADAITKRLLTPINRMGLCNANRLALQAAAAAAAARQQHAAAATSN